MDQNGDTLKGKNVNEYHFHPEIDLHYDFHVTCALLKKFGIFDYFDHIFHLPYEPFSTPQSGYDPDGPKILIVTTST